MLLDPACGVRPAKIPGQSGDDRPVEHVGLPGEPDRVDALPDQGGNRYPRGLIVEHHHQITFPDTGIHHAVACHIEGETPTRAGDPAFDQHLADYVFLGQDGLAGRHSADDGDGDRNRNVILRIAQDDNAAGLSLLPLQVALPYELAHLAVGAGVGYPEMGRTSFSRSRSRPLTVRSRKRIASWMSGARLSRFMIWVMRARVT